MFDQTNQQNPYMMGGFQQQPYGYAQQQPKIMNYLTPEEIKSLQAKESTFNLCLTETESLQARCNHRLADGSGDSLRLDPTTGLATCTICGYKFRPIDPDVSLESITDATDKIVDILQTIKILYTDLPGSAAAEYFQIIPLIGKIPKLFEFASKSFAKHEYNYATYNQMNMGGMAMLNNLQSAFGGGFGMAQPQYNPYAAPQQPVGYPGAQPQPMANPFGYPGAQPQPMMGYQPQTAGFAYQPNMTAPTAAPVAPAAAPAADTSVSANVSV